MCLTFIYKLMYLKRLKMIGLKRLYHEVGGPLVGRAYLSRSSGVIDAEAYVVDRRERDGDGGPFPVSFVKETKKASVYICGATSTLPLLNLNNYNKACPWERR